MKKSDLIPGKHAIKMRDGWVGLVLEDYIMGLDQHYALAYYTENLLDCFYGSENDVMCVFEVKPLTTYQSLSSGKVLWKRKEVKEVTMKEVEEKFGCEVKIIK